MNRLFGIIPLKEVEIEKTFINDLNLKITIQAGKNGYTIIYDDVIDTAENNFNIAYNNILASDELNKNLKEYSDVDAIIEDVNDNDIIDISEITEITESYARTASKLFDIIDDIKDIHLKEIDKIYKHLDKKHLDYFEYINSKLSEFYKKGISHKFKNFKFNTNNTHL